MTGPDNLTGATNEALVAELARRASQLPDTLKQQLSAALAERTRPRVEGALADAAETTPENPTLTRFKAQYEGLKPEDKDLCTWQEAEKRLLENDGRFLKLAEAMEGGGVLFGVDRSGKLLFADGGAEPIMTGKNYADTRKAVMFAEKEGKQVSTGYEMFPYSGDYEKSDEIRAYEASVKDLFVRSENRDEYRGSWLESGEKPDWPRLVRFYPDGGSAHVFGGIPRRSDPRLGVRRLLRV